MATDTHTDPPAPPSAERRPQPAVRSPRRGLLSYVVVAALSIGLGAVAMRVATRVGWLRPAPAPGAPATSTASGDQGAGVSLAAEAPSETAVYISPARQQLIGVRTAAIAHQSMDTTIRTTGVLAYDETRIAEVHTKIAGWIEDASVDFVGQPVRRGEALFSVYSPDLVATQKEYLLALKARAQLGQSLFADTRDGATSLVAAARERLRLWDLTDAQVADLEKTGEPRKSVTLYSPFDGVVLERTAFPGQYVTPEMRMFKIADLSTIWVMGQIFEYEVPLVKLGQEAEIQFPYGPSTRAVKGRITFIAPEVDPMTRRVTVRIALANPGVAFKPDAYVTVLIHAGGGSVLAVPKEAVIDNGDTRYVILALADGYFEPRQIQVGAPVDAFYPVLAGLAHGDRVVTSAQFLIDSETNLQAAMQSMGSMPGMDNTGAQTDSPATQGPPSNTAASPAAPSTRFGITFSSRPDPPRVGENNFEVSVKDGEGQPVSDASVEVVFFMPAMPSMGMPAMRNAATLADAGGGTYRGTGQVLMAGRWDVTVTVTRAGQRVASRKLAIVAR